MNSHSALLCAQQPCVWKYLRGIWGRPCPTRPPSFLSRCWWLCPLLLNSFPPPPLFPPSPHQPLVPPPLRWLSCLTWDWILVMVDMSVCICDIMVWFWLEDAAMLAMYCCNCCSACCLAACRVDAGVENGLSSSVDGLVMQLTTSSIMAAEWLIGGSRKCPW